MTAKTNKLTPPLAAKTKKPKALTAGQAEVIERCLAILEDHGNPSQNTGDLRRALEAEGVKFTQPTGTNAVAAVGIRASATSGPGEAVRLWAQKARRALLRGEV